MDENNLSGISQADTDEKIGDFWDTHDFAEFDTDAPDVEFEIACAVPIEAELYDAIEQQAHKHGVKVETLVNLWLQQKLTEQVKLAV
ncbi:MAG: CopG family antitoxin [Gammaproteobacteria bacterium]